MTDLYQSTPRSPGRPRAHPAPVRGAGQPLRRAHPSPRGHPRAPAALGAGHDPRLPERDLRLERPPRVRDPPHHQDPRQLHRRRPHRHLRPRARQHHRPEPAARLGQRPRAGPGGRRPRRRHPVHRRVDPAVHAPAARAAGRRRCPQAVDPRPGVLRGHRLAGRGGDHLGRQHPRARAGRPPLQAARPDGERAGGGVGDGGQRVDGPPRRRRGPQRGGGRPQLHLLQPHRRHPADHGGAARVHVRADLLQVLQAGHRPDLQQHGQEAAGRARPTAARLDRPPDHPGGHAQRLPQHGELQPAVPRRGGHHAVGLPPDGVLRRSRPTRCSASG